MSSYRIERRREGQATEYWGDPGNEFAAPNTWVATADHATIYTEAQRRAALNGWLLPPEGCWVRLDDEPTHTSAEKEEAAQLAYASGLGVSEWPAFLEMAREALRASADDNDPPAYDGVTITSSGYGSAATCQPQYIQTAPAFTVQHLAIVRQAVAAVIADGDPSTPRVDGKPVWSTEWQLYAAGKAEAFVDAVAAKVVGMVAGTSDDSNRREQQ